MDIRALRHYLPGWQVPGTPSHVWVPINNWVILGTRSWAIPGTGMTRYQVIVVTGYGEWGVLGHSFYQVLAGPQSPLLLGTGGVPSNPLLGTGGVPGNPITEFGWYPVTLLTGYWEGGPGTTLTWYPIPSTRYSVLPSIGYCCSFHPRHQQVFTYAFAGLWWTYISISPRSS